MRPVVVPIQLGCCHEVVRCRLCSPAPQAPSAEVVRALISHYRDQHDLDTGRPFWVSFFGGPPPTPSLIEACDGLPFTVRVRPDLLSKSQALQLKKRGATAIELDTLSFDNRSLKEAGRAHRGKRVLEMADGLRTMGYQIGLVLAPGLPSSSFETCMRDAAEAAEIADTVRLHPVLVYAKSELRNAHMDGTYTPLELGEAVTVCAAMADRLEVSGVRIIRMGIQPGPDGVGRAVAGPHHPSFRQLVEGRRALRVLHELVAQTPSTGDIIIRCHPDDETRTRGPLNQNIRDLRATHQLQGLCIQTDTDLSRGHWAIEVKS